MFQTHNKVMIESLGIGEGFSELYAALAKKYFIKMIRGYADAHPPVGSPCFFSELSDFCFRALLSPAVPGRG